MRNIHNQPGVDLFTGGKNRLERIGLGKLFLVHAGDHQLRLDQLNQRAQLMRGAGRFNDIAASKLLINLSQLRKMAVGNDQAGPVNVQNIIHQREATGRNDKFILGEIGVKIGVKELR